MRVKAVHRGWIVFVQHLTVRSWCCTIAPHLWRQRLAGQGVARCYILESSRIALAVAHTTGRALGLRVEPLIFDLMDLRDERGLSLLCRVVYHDLAAVQAEIRQEPAFREMVDGGPGGERWPMFLARGLTPLSLTDRAALWRVLLVIQICAWHVRRDDPGRSGLLFLARRPWWPVIARYASAARIAVVGVPASFSAQDRLRWWVPPGLRRWLRRARGERHSPRGRTRRPQSGGPRIAVDSYGHFNLGQPERHSDLFFWQQSPLAGSDLTLFFTLPKDPLDHDKRRRLAAHGIEPVVINPPTPIISWSVRERAWFQEQCASYQMMREAWQQIFEEHRIKVYVTWFKYDGSHCAIGDALQHLGGVFAMYQRSHESSSAVHTAVATELFFGFSRATAEIERRSGSIVPYYVITGYLGDHRFPLLRQEAARVRQTLQAHGALRVLGYADENSVADQRWYPGHAFMRRHYAFLLEKVLSESWLGLVIKPKVPSTLRQRLGPVAELLRRAEATGRCYVYEDGAMHGSFPPAVAALAADIMIHGHLHAATAGVESALAGVPTLLMDGEGWSVSSLYELGVGRVVFTAWEALWKACLEHWNRPGGVPGFGDWASRLDAFDPFRDGRAAQRMGTYVQWLLEGLKAGVSRETVMADAAQRYAAQWGRDKILQIGTERGRVAPSQHGMAVSAEAVPA